MFPETPAEREFLLAWDFEEEVEVDEEPALRADGSEEDEEEGPDDDDVVLFRREVDAAAELCPEPDAEAEDWAEETEDEAGSRPGSFSRR